MTAIFLLWSVLSALGTLAACASSFESLLGAPDHGFYLPSCTAGIDHALPVPADVSFLGPLRNVQVGPVNYAYYRFGPLEPATAASALGRLGTLRWPAANPLAQMAQDAGAAVAAGLARAGQGTSASAVVPLVGHGVPDSALAGGSKPGLGAPPAGTPPAAGWPDADGLGMVFDQAAGLAASAPLGGPALEPAAAPGGAAAAAAVPAASAAGPDNGGRALAVIREAAGLAARASEPTSSFAAGGASAGQEAGGQGQGQGADAAAALRTEALSGLERAAAALPLAAAAASGAGPAARPLVLIMGLAGTMGDWTPALLRGLAAAREVVIFDNAGIGRSELALAPNATAAFFQHPVLAASTVAFMQAIGLTRPDILGWSLGAKVVLNIAVGHGPNVSAVIAVAGSAGGRTAAPPQAPPVLAVLANGTLDSHAEAQLRAATTDATLMALCNYVRDKVAMPPDPPQPATIAAQLRMERAYDAGPGIAASLGDVANPVLLVTGTCDTVDPPADQATLIAGLKYASLARFADAGHIVMFQETARFVEAAVWFLGLPLPAALLRAQGLRSDPAP